MRTHITRSSAAAQRHAALLAAVLTSLYVTLAATLPADRPSEPVRERKPIGTPFAYTLPLWNGARPTQSIPLGRNELTRPVRIRRT